MDELLMTRA